MNISGLFMKALISFVTIALLFVSCTVFKHKEKSKEKTEIVKMENTSISSEVKSEVKADVSVTDSTVQQTAFSISKTFGSIAQNFTLKNNGKCADGGEIRFLRITDAQGNQTEIPVNNNTDLSFNSESEITRENASLKTENSKLTKEKTDLQTKYDAEVKARKDLEKKQSALQINTDSKSERSQLTAFLWCIVLTVVFWESGKFFIKKQFLKP